MFKRIIRMSSLVLVMAMLINILPANVLAASIQTQTGTSNITDKADVNTEAVYILGEVVQNRTKYSKEFRMSNGLKMATLYAQAIHYEDNGEWKEIDNTLKISGTGKNAAFTNTAGPWTVSFPQQMSADHGVTITKDGYTLSFAMSGELHTSINKDIMTASTESSQGDGQLERRDMLEANAQEQKIDISQAKEASEYPETVPEKLHSRLEYKNVFENTNIIYDLTSNRVKESIVIEKYNKSLQGYRYTLNAGGMIPRLTDSGQIELYDKTGKDLVMVMPAPYLVDSAEEYNVQIAVDLRDNGDGTYVLSYYLPTKWLAEESREWPIILDPIVQAESTDVNIHDQTVYSQTYLSYGAGVHTIGYRPGFGIGRTFLQYMELPVMTSADVIVSAFLSMEKPANSGTTSTIEAHKVLGTWASETITWSNKPDYDDTIEDFVICHPSGTYTWDVTDIVREWYIGENTGLMLKANDEVENGGVANWKQFYSCDYSYNHCPTLYIMFRNNNGLESYWDYTASSAGRAGTGYINNYTGNLVWTHGDIGFDGNLMPVSISHIYNANDSANNKFGLGYGWRTNFNQLVYQWSKDTNYYVWEDADGTSHYFKKESNGIYKDEDGLELTLTTGGSGTTKYCITDKYGNASYFDTYGRLTEQRNNQKSYSSITISYATASGYMISSITDGVGRVYNFTGSNLLDRISYAERNSDKVHYVSFGYSDSKLTSITNVDGETVQYTYADNTNDTSKNLLATVRDIDGYKLSYTYTSTTEKQPARVASVTEFSGTKEGGFLTLEYANNQTTFRDHNDNMQIMQFNNFGNTVSVQDNQGRAQFADYANNDATTESAAKGNQMTLSSKLQNTVGNLLQDSSFENSTAWTATSTTVSRTIVSGTAYMGNKSLKLTRASDGTAAGVYSDSFTVAAGETYTFSAYVKTVNGNAYLALHDGSEMVTSEIITADQEWTRLEVSYTADSAKTLTARLMTEEAGTFYMDCVQVEKAETASRYNLVQNGDFRDTTFWSSTAGIITPSPEESDAPPAPELSNHIYKMTGNPTAQNRISQTIDVSGVKGDKFILTGWAKGDSAPLISKSDSENVRQFSLIAVFTYTDNTTPEEQIVRFNPDADSSINWQYAALEIEAKGTYSEITVIISYDYNVNTAYFDGIQLFKEEFGTSYEYDENGNVVRVRDIQGGTTTYTYDTKQNLTGVTLPDNTNLSYTYDNYHNVLTATTETGVSYAFTYDDWGNNTSVSITSGSTPITTSAIYSSDGNRLVSTTDAAGQTTTYNYNADTNVLEWVKYPNDTDATRTNYTYDDMCRLVSAAVTTDTGSALTASYSYDNDLLTKIQTASTTYNFTYGDFALRTAVKVGTQNLATYSYTNRTNYLEALEYGNEDSVQYTYDDLGRITQETYEDGDTVTYKYDNSGALATVTDSATGITTTYYYDFTDRLMKYVESDGINTHSVGYEYDTINNLTKLVETINGITHETSYTYDLDNRVTTVTTDGINKGYTYDAYGRVTTQAVGNESGTVLTETFGYNSGNQITSVTVDTAGQDVAYTYTYDNNGNILSVSDGTNTTSYVYDSANQLLRENNQAANKTWVWTYDNAGNIQSKSEYAYTTGELGEAVDMVSYGYDNDNWRDLLTSYDGVDITYDEIGNPLNDGTWTYTWQHGRELERMSDGTTAWTFTYDANGMRTSRTDGTTTYNYVYNGGSLVQMTVGSNTLYFTSDTITFNGVTYYYVKNLQGDVTAIVDGSGATVATYVYDAWGNLISDEPAENTIGHLNPIRYRGYVYDSESGFYYLQSRYYDPEVGRFINADDPTYLGSDGTPLSFNLFTYCTNNPISKIDETGCAPKWWESILVGVAVIAVAAIVTAAVVTTGGGAGALLATAVKIAAGAVKVAATAGAVSATVRTGRAACRGETDISELGKTFVVGFADGFKTAAMYSAGCWGASVGSYQLAGCFNKGYGWSSGKWLGGYQTPNTYGISIATYKGGKGGGRSFAIDLDIYNGLHYHTNKYGTGKSSKWIKQHHWEGSAIFLGLVVGFSEEESEW